jgi:hypothetical protein
MLFIRFPLFSNLPFEPPDVVSAMPRGIGWKRPELEFLLQLIEERLPVGGEEWAKVAELHVKEYPDNQRDKDSIKRKYSKLYLTKMPTGDPSCPWSVRRAKFINEQIKRKCDITEGNSDIGSDEDDNDPNDDDCEDAKENEDEDSDGEPAERERASVVVPNVTTVSCFLVSLSSCIFCFINLVLLLCLGFQ